MRRPAVALIAVLVIGLAVLMARALNGKEVDVTRPGILTEVEIVALEPGHKACQQPLDLDRSVNRIGVAMVATDGPGTGPRMKLEVRDFGTGEVLADADIAPGWTVDFGSQYVVDLSKPTPAGRAVAVCAINTGKHPVTLAGRQAIANAALVVDGGSLVDQQDWAVYFPLDSGEQHSWAAISGDILKRASVLRPGFITPLTYVLLGLLLVVGGAWLLIQAVSRAAADPPA